MGFRTREMAEKYDAHMQTEVFKNTCVLCDREPLQAFTHWKIIANHFPYDKIASLHEMIVPYRHVTENELSDEEIAEFREIKGGYINDHYDYVLEAVGVRSIPEHHHVHLVKTL